MLDRARKWAIVVLLPFAVFGLFFFKMATPLPNDWSYFNSLALVVRSIVLGYGQIPFHNPWVCGGLDILTNPQNRLFSPFFLSDLAFDGQWANLFSLLVYCAIGFAGAKAFFRDFGLTPNTALICSILFVCGSWFGLHFTEGHIPYGSMQLLPLIGLCGLRFDERRYQWLMALLLSWFLLDGGFYSFIFSGYFLLTLAVMGKLPLRKLMNSWKSHRRFLLYLAISATLISLPKMVPVLRSITSKQPWIDAFTIPLPLLAKALFWPLQNGSIPTPEVINSYRFHELGCYLSLIGLALIGAAVIRNRDYFWKNARVLVALLFWFWVGSGVLLPFNPWSILQKIPLLNIAHVESRVFILMYVFFVLLVGLALDSLRLKPVIFFNIASLLIIEALFVRNYTTTLSAPAFESLPNGRLISSTIITTTRKVGWTPGHYLLGNIGSSGCYEPSFFPENIRTTDDINYKGEAYSLGSTGRVQLLNYEPGHITASYDLKEPATIEFNTNALSGWKIKSGKATLSGKEKELLRATPADLSGQLELVYVHPGFGWLLFSYCLGICGFLWCAFRLREEKKNKAAKFDYSAFPPGFYQEVIEKGHPIRRAWHMQKFQRVLDCLPKKKDTELSILDIGCFAGTFLSLLPKNWFSRQIGVDILPTQVKYATEHFGTEWREFSCIKNIAKLSPEMKSFDCITLIEVIEHLNPREIIDILEKCSLLLKDGGKLIVTTPNYASAWPLVEILINKFSDVSYEEQHITKFTFFNVWRKLNHLSPIMARDFSLDFKTTTHSLSPFVASISLDLSMKMSRIVRHKSWHFPFGNLLLVSFTRHKRTINRIAV